MNNRRDFLKKSALLSLAGFAGNLFADERLNEIEAIGNVDSNQLIQNSSPFFELPPLTYSYDALEPFIDSQTMEIHYSKHHKAYVDNLNKALSAANGVITNENSIEYILSKISDFTLTIRNNGGGHYNHSLFWKLMKPNKDAASNLPTGKLSDAINAVFGNFESFKSQFSDVASKRFGSGWAWLYQQDRQLKIGSTPNQDNPLMNNAEINGKPLLALDVWEHAYYLKYQNKRAEYISNWWNVVNWDAVAANL